jgi:predicted phosphodiesterase
MPIPEADLLIHAGDACLDGNSHEVSEFFDWFCSLKAKHKVFVAGNHDGLFEKSPDLARSMVPKGVTYLEDSMTEVEGLRIWGSPWQPEFQNWAFNLPRGPLLKGKWDLIPAGIDILVTHGPPMGVLDWGFYSKANVGCEDLADAVLRVKPRLHVFGHIHGSYGLKKTESTLFVNAAMCDEGYRPVRDPVVVELGASGPATLISGGHAAKRVERDQECIW